MLNHKLDNVILSELKEVVGQDGKLIKSLIQKMLVIEPLNRSQITELLDKL